jgi:N-acetylglutamate synthase/N-acetylornithine aminotransferase
MGPIRRSAIRRWTARGALGAVVVSAGLAAACTGGAGPANGLNPSHHQRRIRAADTGSRHRQRHAGGSHQLTGEADQPPDGFAP